MTATANAQTIVKGDMNDDNEVTIADVTSLVNVVLGKSPLETISAGCSCEPYQVDNSSVVGSWSTPDGTSFEFKEDGTTTFPGGATYEFMPMQGRLIVYDTDSQPVKVIPLLKIESEKILTVDYSTNTFTYFTKLAPEVTYYWYVGVTQPTSQDSITPQDEVPFTRDNWHTIDDINATYSFSNPLYNSVANPIAGNGGRANWYVAVPSISSLSIYESDDDNEVNNGNWTIEDPITVEGVTYNVYKSAGAGYPHFNGFWIH